MKTLFLWDIDGTILLSGGAGKAAFDRVFQEIFEEDYVWQNIVPDGRTDDSLIDELFEKRFQRKPSIQEKEKVVTRYNQLMEEECHKASRFRLMPQAKYRIESLSQLKHIQLGLVTGNYKISAYHKLRRVGLDHYFPFGGFGCDAYQRQDVTRRAFERGRDYLGAEPLNLYTIGDTVFDIQCGKGIGAQTIAVATGSTSYEDLKKEKPDFLLEDLRDFESIMKYLR